MIRELDGARVLLTGATGGLGRAIARCLHDRGAQLLVTGRNAGALQSLADELGASPIPADLSRPEEAERLVAEAGELDVLVVNHALPATGYVLDLEPATVQNLVTVNLTSPILLAQAAGRGMKDRGSGQVVLVGSLTSKAATAGSAMYNATKFGLRGFSLAYRQDLHGTGVGVSLVMPGFVSEAGMFHDSGVEAPPGAGTVTPDQVAHGVVRAIEKDRAEVAVAPIGLRAGTTMAHLLPEVSALVQRRFTPPGYMDDFIAGQSDKA